MERLIENEQVMGNLICRGPVTPAAATTMSITMSGG
jgi:hypothetical protein